MLERLNYSPMLLGFIPNGFSLAEIGNAGQEQRRKKKQLVVHGVSLGKGRRGDGGPGRRRGEYTTEIPILRGGLSSSE